MKKYLLLLIVLSLLACWPFFKKGYFESHDGEWMVIRFTAFHQALIGGQFPVRYVERLNNNYGYPVLNFLYPLPFYLAEIPKILGFGFVDSIKIIFVLSTISSTLAMFWALSQVFGKNAALAGAIIYLFIPYRFVDLYVRGSIGENLAFTLTPIIAGCIFKIKTGQRLYLPILSAAIGLLVISHNVIAAIFIPFFVLFSTFLDRKNLKTTFFSFLLGILTATFFWLPAIYDLRFVRLSQIKVSEITDHLVGFGKLIIPSWDYGPNPNSPDGLSVQIGIVSIFIFATTVFLMYRSKTKSNLVLYLLLVYLIVVIANIKQAAIFWQNIPGVDVIQFPWRMLSILVFVTAYLTAHVTSQVSKNIIGTTIVAIAAISSTIIYTKPLVFVDRGDSYYATNEDTTNVRDEYLPLWAKDTKERASQKIELLGPGQITSQSIKHLKYTAQIDSPHQTTLQINTIYFPDFQAKMDGTKVAINYDNPQGLINVKLPSGRHEVIINYTRSTFHLAAEIVSVMAIFLVGTRIFKLWRK